MCPAFDPLVAEEVSDPIGGIFELAIGEQSSFTINAVLSGTTSTACSTKSAMCRATRAT